MNIIKTIWEKRNLNCNSYEITINQNDCLKEQEVINKLTSINDYNNSYIVIKLPIGNLSLLHKLEKLGFNYMETQFTIIKKIDNFVIPKIFEKIYNFFEIEYLDKNQQQWDYIISLISDNMFTTDRIYLDELLSKNTSALRYKNWMRDLYDNENAWMAIFKKNGTPYMFNCCINNFKHKTINYLLAGVFEKYKNSGYGSILPILTLKYGYENNYKKIIASISSNNLAILKLYEYYGFYTQDVCYVLRKYMSKEK